jgi:hypothetical protein
MNSQFLCLGPTLSAHWLLTSGGSAQMYLLGYLDSLGNVPPLPAFLLPDTHWNASSTRAGMWVICPCYKHLAYVRCLIICWTHTIIWRNNKETSGETSKQTKSSSSPAGGAGLWKEWTCAAAAAVLSPCPDSHQPHGFHFGGNSCLGTCSSKAPLTVFAAHRTCLGCYHRADHGGLAGFLPLFLESLRQVGKWLPKSPFHPITVQPRSDADKKCSHVALTRSGLGGALVARKPTCVCRQHRPAYVWTLRSANPHQLCDLGELLKKKALLFSGIKWAWNFLF